jgi:hypothetical protein
MAAAIQRANDSYMKLIEEFPLRRLAVQTHEDLGNEITPKRESSVNHAIRSALPHQSRQDWRLRRGTRHVCGVGIPWKGD